MTWCTKSDGVYDVQQGIYRAVPVLLRPAIWEYFVAIFFCIVAVIQQTHVATESCERCCF